MADPREEVEAVVAEMRDPQLHHVLDEAAAFLHRRGVGEGSAAVDATRRLLRQAADRLDAARSTQPEDVVRLCVQTGHPIHPGNYQGPIHCTAHSDGHPCVTALYRRLPETTMTAEERAADG